MSEYNNVENTSNFQHNQYDTSIVFLRDNFYSTEPFNNETYLNVTLTKGTVMGRVTASNYIVPVNAGVSDGSELPIGILAEDVTVLASSSKNIPLCVKGEIAEEKVNFDDADDTLDTVVDGVRYKDRLTQIGLILIPGTELSDYDNQ